jgi:tetratricopeptide (TPR) repeat protein
MAEYNSSGAEQGYAVSLTTGLRSTASRCALWRSLAPAILVLLFAVRLSMAEGEVRLSVKVLDAEGKPVPNLVVALVDQSDRKFPTRRLTTNKKGAGAIPNLSPSKYAPMLESDAYRIMAVAYTARKKDGSIVAEFEEEDARAHGIPAIQMVSFSRGQLDLTVTEIEATQQQEQGVGLSGLADASGELEILNALFDLGRWDELLARSEAVLEVSPDLGGAHYLRAIALWQTGRYAEGAEHLRRACDLIPDQPNIHGVMASLLLEHSAVLRRSGDEEEATAKAEEAIPHLRKQLELTPGSQAELTNLVIALEATGRTDEAIAALESLIEVTPDDIKPYLRLADLRLEAGEVDAAIETLERFPGGGREISDLLFNAGVQCWNDGRLDDAIETMHKVIERDPANPDAYRLLGRSLIASGKPTEGVRQLKEYIRIAPEGTDVEVERRLIEALEGSE